MGSPPRLCLRCRRRRVVLAVHDVLGELVVVRWCLQCHSDVPVVRAIAESEGTRDT